MFQVELSPSDIKYIFTIKLFDTDKKLFIDPALMLKNHISTGKLVKRWEKGIDFSYGNQK